MRRLTRTALAALLILRLVASPASSEDAPAETFRDDQRAHWAFKAAVRPEPPEVEQADWVRNPIDRFLLAGMEEVKFAHAPEADRLVLIRRLSADLIGLPPTPVEVERTLRDNRPESYGRLVDRLLASPQHGVRWAQHWLDLAHYADTNGFEADGERPDSWRYRDWVVDALNADMPFDEFLSLQIAGDELRPGDPSALIATGFGRCGPREVVGGNVDPASLRQAELTEVTGTVGSVFLGLTMACARCHNHKFDPLPTTDYYRLQSFFAAAEFADVPIAAEAERKAFEAAAREVVARGEPHRARLSALEGPYRETLLAEKTAGLSAAERTALAVPEKERTPEQKKMAAGAMVALKVNWEEVAQAVAANPEHHAERERLKRAIHEIEMSRPRPPAAAMAIVDRSAEAPETFVLKRGDLKNRGPRVAPRPPGILLASQPADAFAFAFAAPAGGRRAALARWMSRSDNPLTARVIVNRLWQHHFGRGLVATPSDFGTRGEAPSHPELLDWLATELVAQGWRLKPIHRLIVTSAAYRQSSKVSHPSQATDDPDNALLSRMNRRRLEGEALRDAMLAASGELNLKLGGPGVRVPIEDEVRALIFTEAETVDLWPVTPEPAEHVRRSLYLFRKRNVRYPLLGAFDAPDTLTSCPKRGVSTHALQPLVLLNSPFALDRARAFAGRLYREGGDPIARAYRIALARSPSPAERDRDHAFLDAQATLLRGRDASTLILPTFTPPDTDPAEAAARVDFAQAMLNRNEFIYVP